MEGNAADLLNQDHKIIESQVTLFLHFRRAQLYLLTCSRKLKFQGFA
jgi:hypothetical protein